MFHSHLHLRIYVTQWSAKYISKILKLLEHFYFYILHFLYVRRMW